MNDYDASSDKLSLVEAADLIVQKSQYNSKNTHGFERAPEGGEDLWTKILREAARGKGPILIPLTLSNQNSRRKYQYQVFISV